MFDQDAGIRDEAAGIPDGPDRAPVGMRLPGTPGGRTERAPVGMRKAGVSEYRNPAETEQAGV